MTPLKAIRLKCLDCCCGSVYEVKLCPSEDCPLYPYRLGHNPARKGLGGNFAKDDPNDQDEPQNDGDRIAEEICEKFF